ncbi:alpha/beta hydrolase family protein [Pseudofulvimonas gallinarii]|nr:S9 family peptidase [Pseudofulvimonas gallinarii]THD13618.1 hypothetical protein B1808_07695 [Pseudofulvimonas gallinarii]
MSTIRKTIMMGKGLFIAAGLAVSAGVVIAAEPPPIEQFIKRDTFTNIKISPDGRHYAATVPQGDDKTVLAVLDRQTLKITGLMQMRGKEHIAGFEWVSDERLVVTPMIRDGALAKPVPTGELYAVNADGSETRTLFSFRKGGGGLGSNIRSSGSEAASAHVLHYMPDRNNQILIQVVPWGSEAPINEVRRLNVRTGASTRVVRAPGPFADFVVDRQGNVRLSVGSTSAHVQKIHRRPVSGGDWVLIHDEAAAGFRLNVLGFEDDSRHVLVGRGQAQGADALYRWDIEDNTFSRISEPGVADPSGLLYGIEFGSPYAVISHPDRPVLHYLDPERRESRLTRSLAEAFPGQFAYPTSFTRDGSLALVHVISDRNPGEFYLFDLATMRATYIAGTREWIDPEKMATSRPISLKARDGTDLHGYLVIPAGVEARNLPLVVLPHGGPHGIRDYWMFDPESQLIASRGYAVLRLNFRGSGGYGRQFEVAGYRQWGGAMQDDVADAVRWAVAEGLADRGRVCIYGGSYGGYTALMNPARNPDMYKCAVGYVGVYDLPLMFQDGNVRRTQFGREYLGMVLSGSDLQDFSPVNHASRISIPVFLIHGAQDSQVPITHSERMRAALRKAGNDPQWLVERAEGHGFYTERARLGLYTQLLDFLDRHIGTRATASSP